jgi:hypothetical protein
MKDEKRAHRDAHFQEELESLKVWLISLAYSSKHLEMPLMKVLLTDPSPLFRPQQQLKKRMGEHAQEPQYSPTFMQSTALAPPPVIVDAFANKSHKTKSSDDIDQDKMAALKLE